MDINEIRLKGMHERKLAELKHDLKLLKNDLGKVKHNVSITYIEGYIGSIERRIEQTEFKLWKLEKEGF